MAAQLATKKEIRGALALAQQISKLPATTLWLDYDAEADVLYIRLKRPPKPWRRMAGASCSTTTAGNWSASRSLMRRGVSKCA